MVGMVATIAFILMQLNCWTITFHLDRRSKSMIPTYLRIKLNSAATFGRADGVAGLVDREIENDKDGFPFLRGRSLKGLLAENAENVVFALEEQNRKGWRLLKEKLFGQPGRGGSKEQGILHVGDATLPQQLRFLIQKERLNPKTEFTQEKVFNSLTGIRRQTSVNPDGGSDEGSLRAMRVLLRGVVLHAPLSFDASFNKAAASEQNKALALLAAIVLDFRRAGTGRNRGRGWLQADLVNENMTKDFFTTFMTEVL
jgi:hypothetical protein